MLTFNGYIPKRRGLIEHLYDGRLSPMDYLVFDLLLLWADANTGIASTNGTGIVYLSGNQLKLDTVRTSLRRLEEQKYIKRPFYVQGQRGNQQIFIDKFVCTKGKLRLKTLSFADTTDWKNPVYVEITEDHSDNHSESQCDNQPSNETGNWKQENGKSSAQLSQSLNDRTEQQASPETTRETLDPRELDPDQIPSWFHPIMNRLDSRRKAVAVCSWMLNKSNFWNDKFSITPALWKEAESQYDLYYAKATKKPHELCTQGETPSSADPLSDTKNGDEEVELPKSKAFLIED